MPVPWSVLTLISLGNLTNENCWGRSEWFSIVTVHREALSLNILPKSTMGGWKVIELTLKTQRSENLTGRTWFAPVTLTGILMVNSSYSSLGGSSFCLTRKRLHVVKIDLSGFSLAQISKRPFPYMKPRVGLNSR